LGLPANITHTELLGAIRGVGKVYSTVINPPDDIHYTSAAKPVFFTRSQAETLMLRSRYGQFVVMGKHITSMRWNNINSAEYANPEHSRAIRITGPADLMDFGYLRTFSVKRSPSSLDSRGVVPSSTPGMVPTSGI